MCRKVLFGVPTIMLAFIGLLSSFEFVGLAYRYLMSFFASNSFSRSPRAYLPAFDSAQVVAFSISAAVLVFAIAFAYKMLGCSKSCKKEGHSSCKVTPPPVE